MPDAPAVLDPDLDLALRLDLDVVQTGDIAAAVRAQECALPEPMLADPYAHLFVDDATVRRARALDLIGMTRGAVTIRGRFGDEVLAEAVARGVRQVVVLGAGCDTRAWRCALPADLVLFEVDGDPRRQRAKVRRLAAAGALAHRHHRVVTADLTRPWCGHLLEAGFDPGAATLWLAEGLTYFFGGTGLDRLAADLSAVSAPGSALAADVTGPGYYSTGYGDRFVAYMRALGAFSGPVDPRAWLSPYGWRVETYDSGMLADGRCPWLPGPVPERLLSSQHGFLYVHARMEG
ncbi:MULTISPECIES: SAM-dependent methyltransferase [unclassified Nonomuraea]|uniref:SAM-dependent methyltransferase n=1 Tax=unclassified Nonomuraea TaxID=2593643 RepID=UPI0033D3925D